MVALFLTIVFGAYAIFLLALSFGWARLLEQQGASQALHRFSIIVPFRNEANHLPELLADLAQLDYPVDHWEVILVDDHSSDDSSAIVEKAMQTMRHVRLLSLTDKVGKKNAIDTGIAAATGDLIVTTDADCRIQPRWLHHLDACFTHPSTQMVVGPVKLLDDGTFFSRLQAIEFCSLSGTSGATLGLGFPSMCSGANLAFRKEAFLAAGGYSGNEEISSGDDQFLLNKISSRWKGSVRFASAEGALVSAAPSASPQEFARQRLRWAGKWRASRSSVEKAFALLIWMFHCSVLLLVVGGILGWIDGRRLVLLLGGKFFAEAIFLFQVSMFCKIPWRWVPFVILQVTHSFYVVAIGVISRFVEVRWKDRNVTTRV